MRSVLLPVMAGICAAFLSGQAPAESSGEPLRLAGAIERALAHHPELKGFAFDLRAQDARISSAALRPPMQAEVLVEDAAGTGEHRGFSSAQTTLSLSHVIELGDKRRARIAAAEAFRMQIETTRAARQLDVAAEVARRFIDTLREQDTLSIARDAVKVAETTHTSVVQRVHAGRAPAAESARAGVRVARAKLALEHAEHELDASRRYLAAAMGERETRFGRIQGTLSEIGTVLPLEDLLVRVQSSPDFMHFADVARIRDAELRLAEVQRAPDIRAQIGVRRFEDGDDAAIVAGFSVPLFTANRARNDIDIARAERERTEAERETLFLKIQAQLYAEYRELEHAQLEASVLSSDILPSLQGALQQAEYAYRRGRYSYLEWTDAQRELLEARARLVEVCANFHTLRVEIERLTGQSLQATGALR
jgi:cobalt-zinc-cadmium efflux system outer membrane protein